MGNYLFINEDVFDPDVLPEEYLYREQQMSSLASAIKPAFSGCRPVNCLCLGPPATGKTTAVRIILEQLEEVRSVLPVYINCQLISSKQQVFAKTYERIYGYPPPSYGVPFWRLYHAVLSGLGDRTLVVALDDLNALLNDTLMNEVLYALLKAHEEVPGARVGVICVATDVKLAAKLDPRVASVFHPEEVYFPLYDLGEVAGILRSRVRAGLHDGAITKEAFETVVRLSYEANDVRYGIYLLRLAAIEAEERGGDRIDVSDVEAVSKRGRRAFVEKSIKALTTHEKVLLSLIYSQLSSSWTAGRLYKEFHNHAHIGYTKFNVILNRLEGLRFVDVIRKGKTRVVLKRLDHAAVREALSSVKS